MPKTDRPIWVEALLSQDLTPAEHRVWVYLGWRQGDNAYCWPAQATIATDMGLTVQGVRNITRRLEDKGWLRIDRGAGPGRGHRTGYTVTTPTEKVNSGLPFSQAKGSTAVEGLEEGNGQPPKREKVNGGIAKRSTAEARLYKEEHKQGTQTKEHRQGCASQDRLALLAQLRECLRITGNDCDSGLRNAVRWATAKSPEIATRLLTIAQECGHGQPPYRLWMHRVKAELGYIPPTNGKPKLRLRKAEAEPIGAIMDDVVRGMTGRATA